MSEKGFWEGARRLPYFFTWGQPGVSGQRAVLCPQCAQEHIHEPEMMQAHYYVNRTLMCGRCGILIGPAGEGEMTEVG